MDPGTIDTSVMAPEQHSLITRIIHERAEVLTFHSACFAMARGELTNSTGHGAANIPPPAMILADEGMTNPSSQDRAVMGCLRARSGSHPPPHIALALQRNETIEWASPLTAARSLDIFDKFYNPKKLRLRRAVYTLINAVDHLGQNEYAQAFVLAWTVIEHCIARQWDRTIEDLALGKLSNRIFDLISEEGKRLRKRPSDFPVSSRIEVLRMLHPTKGSFDQAEVLRVLRNDFVHDFENISPDDGSRAVQVALQLMDVSYGMNLRLGAGYGYAL